MSTSKLNRKPLLALPAIVFLLSGDLAGQPPQISGTLLFENEHVRVRRVTIPAGNKSEMHAHANPSLEIFLTEDHVRETLSDGTVHVWRSKPNQVAWTGANTHRVENLMKTPVELISIEFKSLPAAAAKAPGSASASEFENEWIKVTRAKLAPREKGAMHSHPMYIGVFLSDYAKLRMYSADGSSRDVEGKRGDTSWRAPVTHRVENLLDVPFEALDINLKSPK